MEAGFHTNYNSNAIGLNEQTQINHIPKIKAVEFPNGSILFIHLDNDRTFLMPLDKFPEIKLLTLEQCKDFEVIDDSHLSFLATDEVYSLEQLPSME